MKWLVDGWHSQIVTVDGTGMERHCLDSDDLGTEELLELGGQGGFEADASCLPSQKCIRGRCKLWACLWGNGEIGIFLWPLQATLARRPWMFR
jgi:hypothetical protein